MSVEAPRARTLHSKRSFGKYPKVVDSPAYDASEEDNDPLTDDGSSVSVPIAVSRTRASYLKPSSVSRTKHHLASNLLSDSDGVDSPTYDGDVESSTTAAADTHTSHKSHHHHHYTSSTSTMNTPITPAFTLSSTSSTPGNGDGQSQTSPVRSSNHPIFISPPVNLAAVPLHGQEEPAVALPSEAAFNPAALTPEDIQAFVQKAINGEEPRKYKINPPPKDRTIRIYADGVYDLFHFGHALQFRQAKLSFPSVYLIIGVSSDEQCQAHKYRTIMTQAERLESARNCRWVDEVVAEAPWMLDDAFLQKYEIDYVAHDEEAYAYAGHDDIYLHIKNQGKFLPTRRTPGISTSDLLGRIVSGYRKRDFDAKLANMGRAELKAEGSDYDDSSRYASRRESGRASPIPTIAP